MCMPYSFSKISRPFDNQHSTVVPHCKSTSFLTGILQASVTFSHANFAYTAHHVSIMLCASSLKLQFRDNDINGITACLILLRDYGFVNGSKSEESGVDGGLKKQSLGRPETCQKVRPDELFCLIFSQNYIGEGNYIYISDMPSTVPFGVYNGVLTCFFGCIHECESGRSCNSPQKNFTVIIMYNLGINYVTMSVVPNSLKCSKHFSFYRDSQ